MRVVSLLPSCTEIVGALGLDAQLVGRSHECDHPESVRHLPICTEPKFNPDGSSGAIDREVKTLVQEGLSVYRVDADRLKALQPDLILTQTQCAVCAVSEADVEAAVREWVGERPQIVSLSPMRLTDVLDDIVRVADAMRAPEQGWQVRGWMSARLDAVAQKAQGLRERPTIACIEWLEPMMAAGNWMPELVRMAGGVNLFGQPGQHSSWLHWERLVEQNPDVIALMPCGYEIGRTKKELDVLTTRPEWPRLRAVRERRVYVCDGNAYFNRPGPRLAESLEILAELLHPAAFRFGHAGVGWERI